MGLLTINELTGLGQSENRARGTWAGKLVRTDPGGGYQLGRKEFGIAMWSLIWQQRRPAGFWASEKGKAWKRVSQGNMDTSVMTKLLVRDIRKYQEEQRKRLASRPKPTARQRARWAAARKRREQAAYKLKKAAYLARKKKDEQRRRYDAMWAKWRDAKRKRPAVVVAARPAGPIASVRSKASVPASARQYRMPTAPVLRSRVVQERKTYVVATR